MRWVGYLAAAALAGVYLFLALGGQNPITSIPETQRQIREMQRKNDELRQKIRERSEYLRKLDEHPELRDREIRKGLNKQKPGETTIYLPE